MEVVFTGGKDVFVASGMMPPRMAMVEGGRKRVACSCRGKSGIGVRDCQVAGLGEGCARVKMGRRRARIEKCIVETEEVCVVDFILFCGFSGVGVEIDSAILVVLGCAALG
jgi:hypothetical protein